MTQEPVGQRFLVFDGDVLSQHDRDWHHVSAYEVAALYRVDRARCVFAAENRPESWRGLRIEDFVVLRPDPTGAYTRFWEARP